MINIRNDRERLRTTKTDTLSIVPSATYHSKTSGYSSPVSRVLNEQQLNKVYKKCLCVVFFKDVSGKSLSSVANVGR